MSIQKTTTELETLKINYLTQEMYEDALENDEINSNELYFTPDTLTSYTTFAEAFNVCGSPAVQWAKIGQSASDGPTPDKTYGYGVLTRKTSSSFASQLAINSDVDVLYYRRLYNGTWQPWVTIPGTTSLSLSLPVANWSSTSQTITATGVTASNNVIISPAPASIDNYVAAGIKCTTQAANSLTFTCVVTPTVAISVNVLVMN